MSMLCRWGKAIREAEEQSDPTAPAEGQDAEKGSPMIGPSGSPPFASPTSRMAVSDCACTGVLTMADLQRIGDCVLRGSVTCDV